MLAFATALWARDRDGDRVLAALVLLETSVLLLPWRLPRSGRSARGYWVESLAALIAPIGAVVVGVAYRAPWTTAVGGPWWYLGAAVAGISLLAIANTNIRRIASGEIAFLLGPARRSHARARACVTLASPPGEEALFRGPVVATSTTTAFGLLAAVAFVARHYVQPGHNGRGGTRSTVIEVLAAVTFLGLTVASGSIYPALLAHLINNVPGAIVELQREADVS